MKRFFALVLSVSLCLSAVAIIGTGSVNEVTAEASVDVSNLKAEDLLDKSGLVGWATVSGEGVDAVTGGGNVTPVLATDFETLNELASDNVPRVIIISGTIKTVGQYVNVGSNKTIIGLDQNAVINGGVSIKNACNVIISNLTIHGTWPITKPEDGLGVENSHHIWLDHLSIWDAPDGNLDVKGSSNYITISWCKFWYTDESHVHRFSNLVSSGTGNDATELHHLNVTYHHNWFAELVYQRMPRLLYGKSHVYNNYYTSERNDYCIGVGCYASALIEDNYFKNVNNPHQFMYQGIIPTYITARDNAYENVRGKQDNGYAPGNSSFTAMEVVEFDNPPYTYYPDEAEDVPEIVTAYAGAQNILYGDSLKKPDRAPAVTPYPEVTAKPEPMVTSTPVPEVNDKPITYDEEAGVYDYHGVNSDNSNGKLEITNPFSGMNLSEEPEYDKSGYPIWKNGVTITYWVRMPEIAIDIPVLNFNLAGDREISVADKDMYEQSKKAEAGTGAYNVGPVATYYSMSGKPLTVLEQPGRFSRYNPLYPEGGCYRVVSDGDIAAYPEGADPDDPDSYIYLSYYGEGYYKNYGVSFDEEGGEESLLPEAEINGSLSLYASGSVGYCSDNGIARQLNPNLENYGKIASIDPNNYIRYWGNGGTYSLRNGLVVPTMEEKEEWHFVVTVIKNDWIQTYVDGIKLDSRYLNVSGTRSINKDVAGSGFNMGYGSSAAYITANPDNTQGYGKTILDLITDENTVLTIGGKGLGVSKLRQAGIPTTAGSQLKDIRFYAFPVGDENVGYDRIQTFTTGYALKGTELIEIEADTEPVPTPIPTPTPDPTQTPETTATPTPSPRPYSKKGDVDLNGLIDARDALEVLRYSAKLIELKEDQMLLADVNDDNAADARDALQILKLAAKIIDKF